MPNKPQNAFLFNTTFHELGELDRHSTKANGGLEDHSTGDLESEDSQGGNISPHSDTSLVSPQSGPCSFQSYSYNSLSSPRKGYEEDGKPHLLLPRSDCRWNPEIPSINPDVLSKILQLSKMFRESGDQKHHQNLSQQLEMLNELSEIGDMSEEFFEDENIQLSKSLDPKEIDKLEHQIRIKSSQGIEVMDDLDTVKRLRTISENLGECFLLTEEETNFIENPMYRKRLFLEEKLETLVIDCRYSFEYKGGHIQGAVNINKPSVVKYLFEDCRGHLQNKEFLTLLKRCHTGEATVTSIREIVEQIPVPIQNCEPVIIFHCEFSSKRGPNMWKYLRNLDREMNKDEWPVLTYPQIYLLKKGYSCFVAKFGQFCEPKAAYTSMFEKSFEEEMNTERQQEELDWVKITSKKKGGKHRKPVISRLDF